MEPLYFCEIATPLRTKLIEVYAADILAFEEPIDVLTTSAFAYSYFPSRGTVFKALHDAGISVSRLARSPLIDLRELCSVWLSDSVDVPGVGIRRVGCIEMTNSFSRKLGETHQSKTVLTSIKSYFQMLDIASTCGVKMDTVALPLLGAGRQAVSVSLTLLPILTECVSFLKRNDSVKRICFIERDCTKAMMIRDALANSYVLAQAAPVESSEVSAPDLRNQMAFISYSHRDKNIADSLCAKLERKGIKAWYAPRDVHGAYPAAIANAIGKATHFIVILSENSLQSEHVLNEIALAFEKLPDRIQFKPLRIDKAMLTDSFRYFLTRQHWMDAIDPPLEKRLDEFVESLICEL